MSRRGIRVLWLALAGTLALPLLGAAPAEAAKDKTPPTLKVPHYAAFVVGSQLSNTGYGPDRFDAYGLGSVMTMRVGWKAEDAGSGICGFDVYAVYAGADPDLLVSNSLVHHFVTTATDYNDQFGGGSFKVEGYNIVARDCAGNETTKFVNARPVVTQEDGWTFGYPGVSIAYQGAWGTSRCACWSADFTRKTKTKGAAAVISKTWKKGESVALVMETAPSRGAFRVFIDGKRAATVNTHAEEKSHRMVVWAHRMPAGMHEVRIVNRATPHHKRIDLDAVLTGDDFW